MIDNFGINGIYLDMNTSSNKRGRPPITIQWPEINFTVKDVMNMMGGKFCNVTVQLKINEGLDDGTLTKAGKSEPRTGRPSNIYRKISDKVVQDEKPEGSLDF
jgi:hypothetical protein